MFVYSGCLTPDSADAFTFFLSCCWCRCFNELLHPESYPDPVEFQRPSVAFFLLVAGRPPGRTQQCLHLWFQALRFRVSGFALALFANCTARFHLHGVFGPADPGSGCRSRSTDLVSAVPSATRTAPDAGHLSPSCRLELNSATALVP